MNIINEIKSIGNDIKSADEIVKNNIKSIDKAIIHFTFIMVTLLFASSIYIRYKQQTTKHKQQITMATSISNLKLQKRTARHYYDFLLNLHQTGKIRYDGRLITDEINEIKEHIDNIDIQLNQLENENKNHN